VALEAFVSNFVVAGLLASVAFVVSRWSNRPALAHVLWLLVLIKLVSPAIITIPIRVLSDEQYGLLMSSDATSFLWLTILQVVWLVGFLCAFGVTIVQVYRFSRYLAFASESPEWLTREVAAVAHRMRVPAPRVRLLPGQLAPFIWSLGKTTLYFPENLLDRLSPTQRATVIGHEIAHILRRDHLVRWVELVILGLFWWCPLAWLARRELRRLEEDCCDAMVLATFPNGATTYASAILDTIDFLATTEPMPRFASAIGEVESLKTRLGRILEGGAHTPMRLTPRILMLAFAGVLLATSPRLAQVSGATTECEEATEPACQQLVTPMSSEPVYESVQYLPTPMPVSVGPQEGNFETAAMSPDGQRLAIAIGSEVIVWDLATRRLLFAHSGHTGRVNAIVFSPDGRTIASAGNDATVQLISVRDGTLLQTLSHHTNWIQTLAFTPDGTLLISGGYDKTVRVWNLAAGVTQHLVTASTAAVRAVAVSPNGKLFLSAGTDGNVALWDLETGTQLRSWHAHSGAVRAVAFQPDGSGFVSGGDDRTICIRGLRDGIPTSTIFAPDAITKLQFASSGTVLLAGTLGGHILNINPKTGQLRGYVGPSRPVHTDAITALLPSPHNSNLLSISHDGKVFAWPSAGVPETPRQTLFGHTQTVTCVASSADGQFLATASRDGSLRIWNAKDPTEVRKWSGHIGGVIAVLFANHSTLVSVGYDETIRVWDSRSGQPLRTISLPTAEVKIALSLDSKSLAVVGPKLQGAILIDIETGRITKRLLPRLYGLTAVAFVPDGKRLALGTIAGDVVLCSLANGKEELRADIAKNESIEQIAFSKNGDRAAIVVHRGAESEAPDLREILFWDTRDKQIDSSGLRLNHDGTIHALQYDADQSRLLLASHDGQVTLWNTQSGERLRSLHAHLEAVQGFVVLENQKLITAGDRVAKLWDWPTETQP
jgi:WD40 repeat protein/beta-lactamase regulating signal transducer with metallopeptidase domain